MNNHEVILPKCPHCSNNDQSMIESEPSYRRDVVSGKFIKFIKHLCLVCSKEF